MSQCTNINGVSSLTTGIPCVKDAAHDGEHASEHGVFTWDHADQQRRFHGYRRSPEMMELFRFLGLVRD